MSKPMYQPLKKSYSEDINDLVEKGGEGSGVRGHQTNKKSSLASKVLSMIKEANHIIAEDRDEQATQDVLDAKDELREAMKSKDAGKISSSLEKLDRSINRALQS